VLFYLNGTNLAVNESNSVKTSSNSVPVQSAGFNLPAPDYIYRGPGNYAPLPPNGATDQCCQAHDNAYEQNGISAGSVFLHPFGIGAGAGQLAADATLCNCLHASIRTGPYDSLVGGLAEGIFCH
jgi:hypothetical protein